MDSTYLRNYDYLKTLKENQRQKEIDERLEQMRKEIRDLQAIRRYIKEIIKQNKNDVKSGKIKRNPNPRK